MKFSIFKQLIVLLFCCFISISAFQWKEDYVPERNPVTGNRLHVIQANDTLASLSMQYFNTIYRWLNIYQANSHRYYNRDVKIDEPITPIGTIYEIPTTIPSNRNPDAKISKDEENLN